VLVTQGGPQHSPHKPNLFPPGKPRPPPPFHRRQAAVLVRDSLVKRLHVELLVLQLRAESRDAISHCSPSVI
jgi:hypothetical protein